MLAFVGCGFDTSGLAATPSRVDAGPDVSVDAQPGPGSDAGEVTGDAGPGAGIDAAAGDCVPDSLTCVNDDILGTCRADGRGYIQQPCELGCLEAGGAHCGSLVPSNGIPASALTRSDIGRRITGTIIFNTDDGAIESPTGDVLREPGLGVDPDLSIDFSIVTQDGGPNIGVFSLRTWVIESGVTVRARGNNAFALVAGEEIIVNGVIDVTGGDGACAPSFSFDDDAQCPGPGGLAGGGPNQAANGAGAGGRGTGGGSGFAEGGGGGGGHRGRGGEGGVGATGNTENGAGGDTFGSAALVPLSGGGGGGGGGDEPQVPGSRGGTGGGGGGAVQLVAGVAITIAPDGAVCGINAGGGGAGGADTSAGGGGGGAGGGVLVEAPVVTLESGCVLAANGGSGSGASSGDPGVVGQLSASPAPGSDGSNNRNSGDGGDGSADDEAQGEDGGSDTDEAGGGGGGSGAIRVNTFPDAFSPQGTSSPRERTGTLGRE